MSTTTTPPVATAAPPSGGGVTGVGHHHHGREPSHSHGYHHQHRAATGGGAVVKCGLLKKLKTSRKKWFVLRSERADTLACLEYYDSEKKWVAGLPAKRSIPLKSCFNINRRQDTKHKHVIALYTKDDCFCVVLDSEEELESWLRALLALQHGEDAHGDGEVPRPTYEHVWQVTVLSRGLGTGRTGNYRLCLADKTLSLIRKDSSTSGAENNVIDLNLSNIRSCGNLKNYFYLEIGRSSLLGAGELWMDSEDVNIAQNIHTTIYHAMTTNSNRSGGGKGATSTINAAEGVTSEDLTPKTRTRSSSATEARPNNIPRKQVHSGVPKTMHGFTQGITGFLYLGSANTAIQSGVLPSGGQVVGLRERCDSMPSSGRTRAATSYHHHSPPGRGGGASPVSPPSAACSTTDSAGSSYSLADETDAIGGQQQHPPLTPDEAIEEEDLDLGTGVDFGGYDDSTFGLGGSSYIPMAAPSSSDDGYVDMSPRGRAPGVSPAASLASVTSGTPSTDYRFADYPLDKVHSYLASATADEDASRPARAYSLGSRPDGVLNVRNRTHGALSSLVGGGCPSAGGDSLRDRAASVGSKSKRYVGGRVLLLHGGHPPTTCHSVSGGKSNSAPVLPIAVGNSGGSITGHGSHGSIGRMDDLMEMDFSRGGRHSASSDTTPSGYVEMKPGVDPLQKKTPSTLDVSPYVDMKPSSQVSSDYVDMSGTSPSKNQTTTVASNSGKDYSSFVDINRQYGMCSSNGHDSDHYSSRQRTFSRVSSSPADDYLDMGGGSSSRLLSTSPRSTTTSVCSQGSNDYMALGFDSHSTSNTNKTTVDGYVEMTGGSSGMAKGHHRQLSLDSHIGSVGDAYANMSLGHGHKKKLTTTATTTSSSSATASSNRKERQPQSQPISIHPATSSNTYYHHPHHHQHYSHTPLVGKPSSSPISSLWGGASGRKASHGGGTPPKMHLPLCSPYSSLPRQRHRKDNCNNAADGNSSSSSITTPSSSSTIFPLSLNSPSSPIKPSTTTGTSSSTSAKTDTPSALKIPAAILNAFYKGSDKGKSTVSIPSPVKTAPIAAPEDDYTLMDFQPTSSSSSSTVTASTQLTAPSTVSIDSEKDEEPDYLACSPAVVETTVAITGNVTKNEVMQPGTVRAQLQKEEPDEKDNSGIVEPPYEILRTTPDLPATTDNSGISKPSETSKAPPKLHYASLNLETSVAAETSTSSASTGAAQLPKPTYAQIDFIRTSGEESTKQQNSQNKSPNT